MEVFLLWHIHIDHKLGDEDVKLIGVYSSIDHANVAQSKAENLAGFKDSKEGFEISVNIVDKDEWTSGFVTQT